jgi:hypothetical protein
MVKNPLYTAPALPLVTPLVPTLCGLFKLSSEVDNESYEFNTLKNSDLTLGWPLP